MEIWLNIVFMGIIGAIIGGVTNALAIKMLFRPYEAKYIGKWRLPFTPGLIPKRRDEVAKQMGLLVVNHLLTPETIQEKLKDGKIYNEVKNVLENKIKSIFQSDDSIDTLLERSGMNDIGKKADGKIYQFAKKRFEVWKENNEKKTLQQLIPATAWEKVDQKVPITTDYLLSRMKVFVLSPRGHDLIKQHVEKFFEGRGMFAGMLQSFLDNRNIVDRIQTELVKVINSEGTRKSVNKVIQDEVDKLQHMTLEECFGQFLESNWEESLWKKLEQQTFVQNFMQKPISSFETTALQGKVLEEFVPDILEKGIKQIAIHVESLMKKLDIPDIIKNQVDTFSTQRLEEMVLGITSRELKMITYLGAYLGGIIGIFQGFISVFLIG